MKNNSLSIVIPAHNEEDNISIIVDNIISSLIGINYDYYILFIDDGSTDFTLKKLKEISSVNSLVKYISLSRNFGHQNALKAGLDFVNTDIVIMMDADMQHPPSLLIDLIRGHEMGFNIVNTLRKDNYNVSFFKRLTSKWFYIVINKMAEIEIDPGSADFRLIDNKVLAVLKGLDETEFFYRGLIKWVGFSQTTIDYYPNSRFSGVSKYSLNKMLKFAIGGILAFSNKPLYFAAYLGLFFSVTSLFYVPYIFYAFITGKEVDGWASIVASIAFFGGIILLILGIIGLYISRIFDQGKKRPNYIIKENN